MYPLFLLLQGVIGLPLLQNITIPLPNGTSNHGTPGLLCTPTRWTDIVIFYLANYAAHAVTTRSLPGEGNSSVAMTVVIALFFPAAGAFRGILGIVSLAIFRSNDLEKAARAGALCMVIRTPEWKPQDRDKLHNTILRLPLPESSSKNHNIDKNWLAGQVAASLQEEDPIGTNTTEPTQKTTRLVMYDPPWREPALRGMLEDDLSESGFRIHGSYNVPPGYTLSRVPRRATFIESGVRLQTTQTARLSYNYSLVKILVSLGQAIYAIFTLYRARGDQISQFGYAAFGLTVAPYAIVSVLNLLGSLLCPEFPAIYMVESSIMEEARLRGDEYVFKGTVGKLDEDMIQMSPNATPPDAKETFRWILEPVTVSVDASGEVQVSSETQVELLHILIESAKTPETTVEDGLVSDEKITTDTGKSSDDRIENKRLEKLLAPDKEKTSSLPTDFVTIHGVDTEGSQPTTAQSSKASDYPSEKLLLVPLTNPIKWDESSRQSDDYQIYEAIPGHTAERAWWVFTNHEEDSDLLTNASHYLEFGASLLATVVPVAINGALSRFHKGHSTHAQRVWTMTWLGFGSLGSIFLVAGWGAAKLVMERVRRRGGGDFRALDKIFYKVAIFCYAAPAIGGFVVVGQMLRSYGTCITVS
ncbi:uncharacterized protein PAC_06154 [Phialocephala subalpina]|uniref:Uncharacterized protein n=1 Tax=Phialocephala subalpina TaxID=576137 RepID=A0A1L7WU26_9HELO|nr:uncharacterized protein PAC_06154 [Phialocephala subalpina]